jgi:hypothetical protein
MDHYMARGAHCRRCGINSWRDANVWPTIGERIYLLRWFIWQTWYVNAWDTGDADPWWWVKPWLVARVVWDGLTIMRRYNAINPEGDNECPRNIKALRAELSGHYADADGGVSDATVLLPRHGRHSV